MLCLNLLSELFGYGVPDEQIHSKGQVAFRERFSEFGNAALLVRLGEYDQVQVGLRACDPLDAGTVDPDCGVRQVSFEQRQKGFSLIRGDVDGPV